MSPANKWVLVAGEQKRGKALNSSKLTVSKFPRKTCSLSFRVTCRHKISLLHCFLEFRCLIVFHLIQTWLLPFYLLWCPRGVIYQLFNNYSPKSKWALLNIYQDDVEVNIIHHWSLGLRRIIVLAIFSEVNIKNHKKNTKKPQTRLFGIVVSMQPW